MYLFRSIFNQKQLMLIRRPPLYPPICMLTILQKKKYLFQRKFQNSQNRNLPTVLWHCFLPHSVHNIQKNEIKISWKYLTKNTHQQVPKESCLFQFSSDRFFQRKLQKNMCENTPKMTHLRIKGDTQNEWKINLNLETN